MTSPGKGNRFTASQRFGQVASLGSLLQRELERQQPALDTIQKEAQQIQAKVTEIHNNSRTTRDALQEVFKYKVDGRNQSEVDFFAKMVSESLDKDESLRPARRYLEPNHEHLLLHEREVAELRSRWSRWDEDLMGLCSWMLNLGELIMFRSKDTLQLRRLSPITPECGEISRRRCLDCSKSFRRHFWLPEPFGLSWPGVYQYDPALLLAEFMRRADYNLEIPLATLIGRISDPAFVNLLSHLPVPGAEGLRPSPMTAEELSASTLRKAALQILEYEAIYVGELDTGWFKLGRGLSRGAKLLRNVLVSNENSDPSTLRDEIELLESNPQGPTKPKGFYKLPGSWQFGLNPEAIVDKSLWVTCEACGRKTPAVKNWVLDEEKHFKPTGTSTYVCALCRHVHVGTICWDSNAKGQTYCHYCHTPLEANFQCPKCSFPKGWMMVRCPLLVWLPIGLGLRFLLLE